jgi:hypothetical protein
MKKIASQTATAIAKSSGPLDRAVFDRAGVSPRHRDAHIVGLQSPETQTRVTPVTAGISQSRTKARACGDSCFGRRCKGHDTRARDLRIPAQCA